METIEVRDALLFVAPLAASAITLAALHWFPWNRGVRQLERTTAYALGTLVTVGVPALAMLIAALLAMPQGELFWATVLIVNALVSGATVNACYWVDNARAITLDEVATDARAEY